MGKFKSLAAGATGWVHATVAHDLSILDTARSTPLPAD